METAENVAEEEPETAENEAAEEPDTTEELEPKSS